MSCTWFRGPGACRFPAVHTVERSGPAGVTSVESVCDRHVLAARALGFAVRDAADQRRSAASGVTRQASSGTTRGA